MNTARVVTPDLEDLVSALAVSWAEQIMSRLRGWRRPLPHEWPGTIDEARRVVAKVRDPGIDAEQRERLAQRVQNRAVLFWLEFAGRH